MNWNTFCWDVLACAGPFTEYAYLGSANDRWGEANRRWKFPIIAKPHVSTIINSNGANFEFGDEEYKLVENKAGVVFVYQSPTKSLAYGKGPYYVLIVGGCGSDKAEVNDQCQAAVQYGLRRVQEMRS
ncbi:unnamed protein product [Clavelina lepadiformis]|uniref:Profilin n=1 Tax=Clavelina lepadiformis TaxID=159417 RepID=A0ABP0GJD5_CLALP